MCTDSWHLQKGFEVRGGGGKQGPYLNLALAAEPSSLYNP